MIIGAVRNGEVPQCEIKNFFSTSCDTSCCFSHQLLSDH